MLNVTWLMKVQHIR